jgi:Type II secretion system (T2SS), protein E, N-terminal domain
MAPTSSAAVSPDAAETAEEIEAQALADDRQLEFRARHQLTIDAQAHTLLDPKYAREMRAVPLGLEEGRPVVAVADPSEKRLGALRELVPGDTKFVLVAPESLDALLKSRIFSESGDGPDAVPIVHEEKLSTTPEAAAPPPPEVAPVAPQPTAEAAPAPAPAAPAAAPPVPVDSGHAPVASMELVDAANVAHLAAQLAQAADTLLSLQKQVQGIAGQFEQTRQELREQKEQLALAAAKADQDRARIKSVAASLAEDVARLDQTKADLAERLSGLVLDDQGA